MNYKFITDVFNEYQATIIIYWPLLNECSDKLNTTNYFSSLTCCDTAALSAQSYMTLRDSILLYLQMTKRFFYIRGAILFCLSTVVFHRLVHGNC